MLTELSLPALKTRYHGVKGGGSCRDSTALALHGWIIYMPLRQIRTKQLSLMLETDNLSTVIKANRLALCVCADDNQREIVCQQIYLTNWLREVVS